MKYRKKAFLAGFVNAVLRKILCDKELILKNANYKKYTFPDWVHEIWSGILTSENYQKLQSIAVKKNAVDIVVKENPDIWAQKFSGCVLYNNVVRIPKLSTNIDLMEGFNEGEWWVQGASAASFSCLLPKVPFQAEKPDDFKIYDLCAAPGGKTIHLSMLGADVTAFEPSAKRILKLVENMERMKLSAKYLMAESQNVRNRDETADFILLDAPCSGSGIFQRCPDVLWVKEKKDVEEAARLQDELLENAAKMLKIEGTLLYSVCSLFPCEGEERVDQFLKKHKNFCRIPVTEKEASPFKCCITTEGDIRIWPYSQPHWGDLEGFFVARMKRVS